MTKYKPTEQELSYKFANNSLIWRNIVKILGSIIRYGCIGFCIYYLFDAVKAYAGKESYANVLMDIVIGMKIDKWIGYVFGGAGVLYGSIRNKQLKKTIKNYSEYIKELEKRIDPKRQGSRLNEYGETHEDDR